MADRITHTQAKLEVEAQFKRFEQAIENIAGAVVQDIIKPFCDRHKLRFESGMGAYAFFRDDKEVSAEWESTLSTPGRPPWERAPADYPAIYRVLNIEVDSTSHLFQYMEGYNGLPGQS